MRRALRGHLDMSLLGPLLDTEHERPLCKMLFHDGLRRSRWLKMLSRWLQMLFHVGLRCYFTLAEDAGYLDLSLLGPLLDAVHKRPQPPVQVCEGPVRIEG